jgi:prepilin-type N-terminal cleavage/methylation domain-containing protein
MKKIIDPQSMISCEKGLTLIEVVISMAIFAIGFLAIAGLVVATTRNNNTGNTLTAATMLAREKVEYLKTLPLDQLAAACPVDMEPEIIGKIYAWDCEVGALGASATINTIKVSVQWEKSGLLRQVILQTNTRGLGR